MPHPANESLELVRQPLGEFPEYEQKLWLVCKACGKRGKYPVGRIFIDPTYLDSKRKKSDSVDEAVSFTGLFRCKGCGGTGPWEFPPVTYGKMTALMIGLLGDLDNSPLQVGTLQVFDGSSFRTGAESEDYLRKKVEEHPDDAFLWSRLGNLYDNVGEIDKAAAAFEKAIELDAGEIESNYNLGCYRMKAGDMEGAAACFQRVALHAISAPRRNPELLEGIVRDSLQRLLDLHYDSGKSIPFPPEFGTPDLPPEHSPDDPNVVHVLEMDLGSQQGWDTLTSLCLHGRVPPRDLEGLPDLLDAELNEDVFGFADFENALNNSLRAPAITSSSQRVSRNAPCPCRSGKKYKRCCGGQ